MALNLPETASEIDQRAKVDVKRELPDSNPFLPNSFIGSIITAYSNRVFDFYFALSQAQLESLPDTAVLTLEFWAAIWGITRTPATVAGHQIAIGGTATGVVPLEASFVSSDGKIYTSTASGIIVTQSLAVASITRVGSIATLTTVNNHLLGSNILITVTGAVETEYNVSGVQCTVTGEKTLEYSVSGTPSTPATGTILLGFDSVSIPIESNNFGSDQILLADTSLTIQSPITNVDDENNISFSDIVNGTDQESNESLRNRMLDRIRNPIAHFNSSEIISVAKLVAGVTRVFVEEVTPDVGQVTVYFMRDNDISTSIPDASEVAIVKAALDAIRPANTDTLDLIVAAPVPVITNFIFSAISPNTATMKTAITNSLIQFFAERTEPGVDVVEEAYNAAIFNTVDTVTGEELSSFTLTSPSSDIVIASGEIATLGTVTF